MTAAQYPHFLRSACRAAFKLIFCAWILTNLPLASLVKAGPSPAPASQVSVLGSVEIVQGAILLHFTSAGGGFRLAGLGRADFEIAGADHIWLPAEAHMSNGAIAVSTSLIQQPIAVRYQWQSLAAAVLFNGAGQPVAPFRTDN